MLCDCGGHRTDQKETPRAPGFPGIVIPVLGLGLAGEIRTLAKTDRVTGQLAKTGCEIRRLTKTGCEIKTLAKTGLR